MSTAGSTHKSDVPEARSGHEKSIALSVSNRSGKVENDLIETILGEMKNEFNRGIDIEENEKNNSDESSKDSVDDPSPVLKKEISSNDNNSDIKTEVIDKQNPELSDSQKTIEECAADANDSIQTDKTILASNDDSKHQRTDKESTDINKKMKEKNVVNEETLTCNIETESGSVVSSTPLGKRSLRSKALAVVKSQEEEPTGVKRSARRRSKDSPRESVLQSAIARKEKSFSSLSNSKDKSFAGRSLKILTRHSTGDKTQSPRASKSPAKSQLPAPKSPRLAQQIAEQNSKEEISTNINTESSVINHSDQPVSKVVRSTPKPSVQTNNAQTYTKTGKRRYRPYKGLRYSFTGNNVRRTKPVRKQVKVITSRNNTSDAKKNSEPEESEEVVEVPAITSQPEQLEGAAGPIVKSHAAEFPNVDLCGE